MIEDITWKQIIESDIDQLQFFCTQFELPDRGNEDNLRERLLRHVLNISLPSGEIFLQGKININTASAAEMGLWPFMGDTLIRNILDYREKYGKFYKIEDLMNVRGVGENLFRKMIQFADVSGRTHIKITKGVRAVADMELIKLEDEIRQKAWELQDIRDNLSIDMDSLGELMKVVEAREREVTRNLRVMKGLVSLKDHMSAKLTALKEMEENRARVLEQLETEKIVLEDILPWKFIVTADLKELRKRCTEFGLSQKGDEAMLRDRLVRHVLQVNLPEGELILEGKLNINSASAEEMSLWPHMGDSLVRNIMDYRTKYGKFYTIEDLMNVKGVGESLFRKLAQFVDVSGKTHIKVKSEAWIDPEQRVENKLAELKGLEELRRTEIKELQAERITLEEILPWKFIILGDLEELQDRCEEFGLSPRGDEASLRDRLMRHILKINLPVGELLLEGKLNINTATPEEMSLWPYMGDTLVNNIMDYRDQYGRFTKIEDLMNVKGVGDNLFLKLVQFVDVSGKTHIKVKSGIRADADMELIKLEDEIRNKAWELQDLRDHLEIDIDYLSGLTREMETEREWLGENVGELEETQARLLIKEKELEVLRDSMADQVGELSSIRGSSEEAHLRIIDLKDEAEEYKLRCDEAMSGMDEQGFINARDMKQLAKERAEFEEEREAFQTERDRIENETEAFQTERDRIENETEAFQTERDRFEEEMKDFAEKMESLKNRESRLESRSEELIEKEKELTDLAYGLGVGIDDIKVETVDLPIIVPRDPGDETPEEDRVILDSTDGFIRRVMNVYYEGEKIDEHSFQIVFKNLPSGKSYNILVDSGERKYFLMKNYNPGGAA